MAAPQSLEALFLEHLAHIDRIAGALARRNGLRGDDAEDFVSWVRLRLVENDYEVLRKFRGESALGTYLTVVVAMLARDYRNSRWGRWRPSMEARRRGPLAVRLETLVHRNGHPLAQAAELLRTSGETRLSDRELASLLAALPARQPLRPIELGQNALDDEAATGSAETSLDADERNASLLAASKVLESALQTLGAEDRAIVRMRFWSESSVAEISRGLGVEQKPLYRRIDRLLARLRAHLAAAGVDREKLDDLLYQDAV
jgi:RNA polymerase sigma factor (sigma-70 family)